MSNIDFAEPIPYSYISCEGTFVSGSLSGGESAQICAQDGTVSFGSNIQFLDYCCPEPTPTTTQTPTNTPTESPLVPLPNSATLYAENLFKFQYLGYSTSNDSCTNGTSAPVSVIVYFNGTLSNGTILYLDQFGQTPIFTNSGWFYMDWLSTPYTMNIGGSGNVSNLTVCAPVNNISIFNNSTGGVITDITPYFFIVNSGNFPLTSGNSVLGTHSGFAGNINFTIGTAPFSGGNIEISKNFSVVDCIDNISLSGDYVSDNISFSSTDIVTISFNNGSCI